MKTLGLVTIFTLLVVYGIVGFSILSPFMSAATGNPTFLTIGLLFSSYFILVAFFTSRIITVKWKGIFPRLEEEAPRTWLLLHSFLTYTVGYIFPWFAAIWSMISLFLVNTNDSFPSIFMFTWMILLFSTIGLWSLHLIIGMGYRWFCEGTIIGIQSYSSFALQRLRNRDPKGITYLRKALLMLKNNFGHENLELEELNSTIKALKCFAEFESEIPYDSLQTLALELKRFPSIEHLPKVLSTLNESPKVRWTGRFTVLEKTRRKLLELIVVVAAVLSGLTFLPETIRNTLVEILQSVGSVENIQLIMGFVLVATMLYITSRIGTYDLNPFDMRKFTFSETKLPKKENFNKQKKKEDRFVNL